MCDDVAETVLYETMFVWNEFLSRGIRNLVKNTLWTVALVYGFFKQVLVGCHIFLFIYVYVCVCIVYDFYCFLHQNTILVAYALSIS